MDRVAKFASNALLKRAGCNSIEEEEPITTLSYCGRRASVGLKSRSLPFTCTRVKSGDNGKLSKGSITIIKR